MAAPQDDQQIWEDLVRWLEQEHGMRDLHVVSEVLPGAGRGLFVKSTFKANPYVPPPPVISIPTSALLNTHTLKPHYPKAYLPPLWLKARRLEPAEQGDAQKLPLPLTSTQLITLHLALHHPASPLAGHEALPHDPWAPYLASLPRSFHWHHPLTWLVRLSDEQSGDQAAQERLSKTEDALQALFACLPDRAQALVHVVEKRFRADVKVLLEVLSTAPPFASCPTPPLRSFLWAWLNINSRCLTFHLGLGPADGSNDFTLGPIVDFANHSPSATPVPITLPDGATARKATHYALPATEDMVASHAQGRKTEVLLQYGPHDDAFLLAEYGFVCWKDASGNGNRWNEVRVDALVEAMFAAVKGGEGHTKKRILEDEGYWGDFTLHLQPEPAHPSYRLLPALRLLHLPLSQLPAWRDVLLGLSPSISAANEDATNASLDALCDAVLAQVRAGRAGIDAVVGEATIDPSDRDEWLGAVDSVRRLWEGAEDIAEGVKESVADGVEF